MYTLDDLSARCFNPVPSMPSWTQAMCRATDAERAGQVAQALSHYQLALSCAQEWLLGSGRPTAHECLCALVNSHLCMAGLQQTEGHIDDAANGLAQVHQALLSIIGGQARSSVWYQAAIWHSRDTHAALLAHLATYGRHPAIERAMRCGCLALRAVPAQAH